MPLVRYAVHPEQVSIGKYSTNHGITTWLEIKGEADRANRSDSHLPPEYERNLRASEITPAEAMKRRVTRLSLPEMAFGSGLLAYGSWIRHQQGGWDGRSTGCSFPTLTQIWNPVRTGISYPPARPRNGQFYEAHKDKPFLAYLSFYTVHALFRRIRTLKNTGTKQKKWDLQMPRNAFFHRRLNVRRYRTARSMRV